MYNNYLVKHKYFGLAGICIASFLGCIDLTVVNTIIPAIGREFAVPLDDTQWVASAFMIALSAFMVPVGTMADKYGRKKLLLIGLSTFGLSSLFVGITNNLLMLVLFRFIQGLGCAVLYTVSGAITSYIFDKKEQGKALGILFAFNGLGLAIGPVIGGAFSGLFSWRYAFLINIPLILISILLCFRFIPEQKSNNGDRLDIIGCALLTLFLISLVGFFSIQRDFIKTLALLLLILLLGALFIYHEMRTESPIVRFYFFKNLKFASALLSTFFLAFYYCIILISIPMFFSKFINLNDLEIGLLLLPATTTFSLTSTWIGNRSEKITANRSIVIGMLFFVISSVGLEFAITRENFLFFIIPLIIFGAAWGMILGPSTLIALRSLPEDKAAVAMGTSWTLHNVGGACGVAFAVYVLNQSSNAISEYETLMHSLIGISTLMAVIYSLLNRRDIFI